MLAAVRRIPSGDAAIRAGRFQDGVDAGFDLAGRVLGIVGLGRIGALMARYAQALDMRVLAWSPNLTEETAAAAGARRVTKDDLLSQADIVTLHLVLSERTRGIIAAPDLQKMKPGAVLINTSRGPLVDEAALIAALQSGRLVAGLDVFDQEPLPADHLCARCPTRCSPPISATALSRRSRNSIARASRTRWRFSTAGLCASCSRASNSTADAACATPACGADCDKKS